MKGRRCGWGSSENSQKARGKFSRSHRQRAKAPEKQRAQTASELERRAYGVGTGWARQNWVSLLSKPPLPVVKTKTGGRRKEPQRRALQHPGERTRGLDQEGGCQNLRMGVCFGTRANRIADGLYVWEEGGKRSVTQLPGRCLQHLGA